MLPAGWKRFAYGSLSVGAPRTWTVRTTPIGCFSPPDETVSEYTLSKVVVSSCPNDSGAPAVSAIAIECLRGAASRLYSGTGSTVRVRGVTLHRRGDMVWLQGHGWEGVVLLVEHFGPPGLGRRILATVEPTGRPC